MRLLLLAVVLSFLFLESCSSSRIVLNKEYAQIKTEPNSIVIVMQDKIPSINYDGDVGPEFGPGNQDTLILSFFKKQLCKDIVEQTAFKNAAFSNCSVQGYYRSEVIDLRSGQLEMSVPAKGATLDCADNTPDFVLFLKDLSIGTRMETTYNAPVMGAGGMMMGGGLHSEKKLTYSATVTLWDVKTKQAVLYGYAAKSVSGFFPVITMSEWLSVSSGFTSETFSKSPFHRN